MKVVELIKISRELLKLLSMCDIKTDDYKYIELYADYLSMRDEGLKTSYIVAVLAERYGISEASVYRVLRRFKRTI